MNMERREFIATSLTALSIPCFGVLNSKPPDMAGIRAFMLDGFDFAMGEHWRDEMDVRAVTDFRSFYSYPVNGAKQFSNEFRAPLDGWENHIFALGQSVGKFVLQGRQQIESEAPRGSRLLCAFEGTTDGPVVEGFRIEGSTIIVGYKCACGFAAT